MRMSLEREGRGGSEAEVSKLLSTGRGQPGGILQSFTVYTLNYTIAAISEVTQCLK